MMGSICPLNTERYRDPDLDDYLDWDDEDEDEDENENEEDDEDSDDEGL